jgi:hypothetical protein
MWTPAFDLSDVPTATLHFAAAYDDMNPSGGDHFEVDVWDGTRFQQRAQLERRARKPDVKVRFRYYGNGWDWYRGVDELQ